MSVVGKRLRHLDFVPGRLVLKRGSREDYNALERFHYVAGPPATWAQVWTIYHHADERGFTDLRSSASICASSARRPATPIAVAVLSYPCLNCHARESALNLAKMSRKRRQRFVNQHIRTISRVIIHPTYRGLGLASVLIDCILENCPTRYVEALATMAKAHPLFARSAMKEFAAEDGNKPSYFLFDRNRSTSRPCGNCGKAAGRR